MLSSPNESVPRLVDLYRRWTKFIGVGSFLARRFIARAARTSRPCAIDICLDIGAGTTPYREEISKNFGVGHYFSLDFTPRDSLDVIADAGCLPIHDQSVDLVVCFEVLQHITDHSSALDEIKRVLRPGGFLIISFPFLYGECAVVDFRRWTVAGMARELESRGHTLLAVTRHGGVLYVIINILIWTLHHLVPGARAAWRSPRTAAAYCREGILVVFTLPLVLLSWLAIVLDSLLPEFGCYMGAMILSQTAAHQRPSLEQPDLDHTDADDRLAARQDGFAARRS
jgi:SAM-dependent methyltransferase